MRDEPIAAIFGPGLTGRPGAGAALTVAFGVGRLAGALLVTVFPLRGEPERLALRLFATVATVATALCAFAPTYAFALAGFAVMGLVNAIAFTATLAARTKYAPPYARAGVRHQRRAEGRTGLRRRRGDRNGGRPGRTRPAPDRRRHHRRLGTDRRGRPCVRPAINGC
jgi:MFS family permease